MTIATTVSALVMLREKKRIREIERNYVGNLFAKFARPSFDGIRADRRKRGCRGKWRVKLG